MQKLIRFAITRPLAVVALAVVFALIAGLQVAEVPIEAFPDVTNTQVQVITLAPGRAAEEVERQVTIPIEREIAGLPECTEQRSVSVYGLSMVTLTFEDGADDFAARLRVGERLRQVDLPPGLVARLGPESSPVGEIYRYTIEGARLDAVERRGLQDWVVGPALRRVSGVADIVSMGGFQRQISVEVEPTRLLARSLSVTDVVSALERSNGAVGGHYLRHGSEEYVVRGMGYLRDGRDVARTAITARDGVPIFVRDVGRVLAGSVARRGIIGRGSEDETPQGIVLLRRRSHPARVLDAIHTEVDSLNQQLARRGARIVPYYDRTELIDRALHTVKHNMVEGALLVVIVLAIFLQNLRGPLIVAVVIPLALLTAFLGLRLRGLPANLISLGAIDFGILVDGAVIFVETAYHLRSERPTLSGASIAEEAGKQVVRPIVFSLAIIATALLPVFTMQRVEGRIFAPMAMTYAFAIVGALVWTLAAVPALTALLLKPRKSAHEEHNAQNAHDAHEGAAHEHHSDEPRFITWMRKGYEKVAGFSIRRAWVIAALLAAIATGSFVGASKLGSEFLPELNEGGMFVTAIFPASQSLEEGQRMIPQIRAMIREFPEVREAVSQLGRPEDGTDPAPVNVAQILVSLHPEEQWRTGRSRQQLLDAIRAKLSAIPGVEFVFSQPIVDNVLESISGIKGKVVLKLFGDDIDELVRLASGAERAISTVAGVKDLGLYQTGTVPQLLLEIDRDAVARYGLEVSAVEDVIGSALGGVAATSVWEGERKVDVMVRFPEASRSSVDRIREIPVRTPSGQNIALGALANVRVAWGRAAIQRAQGRRFVALKFNVEGRDLGSVVAEARTKVNAAITLPPSVTSTWGGEFENQQRAMKRLAVIVPIALVSIGLLLFWALRRAKGALVVLATLPASIPGALIALKLAKVNVSVSAAVGFIALLGQTVLAGLVMVSSIDELRAEDPTLPLTDAIKQGVSRRLRAVLVTALLASLGLLPAALSHAIGSETQRPFALVVVGGVLLGTPLVLIVVPALYALAERAKNDASARASSVYPPAFIALLATLLCTTDARAFTFEQALQTMRAQHQGLRAASLDASAARQDITSAERWSNPQLLIQTARSVGWTSYDPTLGAGTVLLTQWIETAGVPSAKARVARALVLAADADSAALDLALKQSLRAAYIELLAAQARRAVLANAAPMFERVQRLVQARVTAGTAVPFDAERLRLAIAEYRAQLSQAQLDCARQRALITVIIAGDEQSLQGDAEGSAEVPIVVPSLADALLAVSNAPSTVAARARAQASDAEVDVQRRSVFGGIGVQAGMLWGQGYDDLQHQRQFDLSVAVTIPIPVLDRGQGAIRGSQLRADAAADRARWVERDLSGRVRLAWAEVTARRARDQQFRTDVGDIDESLLHAADASYGAGRATAFDLLDAYTRFVASKLRRIELATDARRAESDLLGLIGR